MRQRMTAVGACLALAGLAMVGCSDDTTRPDDRNPPSEAWVRSAGGAGWDEGYDLAIDASGGVVVTGRFAAPATFGDMVLNGGGVFIAKYDAAGNLLWARAGGSSLDVDDQGEGIRVDASGNIVAAGHFSDTATFGSTMLTSAGSADVFVAKYDAAGNLLWARSDGGSGNDEAHAVAVDASSNVIITGRFRDSATFGDPPSASTTLTSAGGWDVFIAKYDAAGSLVWARSAGGATTPDGDVGYGVAADASGNVVVTGSFQDSATFGSTTLTSAGLADVFVAKYDADGSLLWARSAGGSVYDGGLAVGIDASGDAVITGRFAGSATFGGTTLASAGGLDVFVAKYDAAGTLLWAHSGGGVNTPDGDTGYGVATDGGGNVIITGRFYDAATFGDKTLTSAGGYDVFVVEYDAAGNLLWARAGGGAGEDHGNALAVDNSANVFMTGCFGDSATFGGTTLTSAGGWDVFVGGMGPSGS